MQEKNKAKIQEFLQSKQVQNLHWQKQNKLDAIFSGKIPLRKNPVIKTKTEYYLLYELGFFGNKALTWNNYEEIINSNWKGGVCIRSKKGIDRKKTPMNIPLEQVPKHINYLIKNEKQMLEDLTFNQSLPNDYIAIQGEIKYVPRANQESKWASNIDLRYSTIKKPTNIALKEKEKYAYGLEAQMILNNLIDEPSRENLKFLQDVFTESVIEFGIYNTPVGNKKQNTLFWEVRNY